MYETIAVALVTVILNFLYKKYKDGQDDLSRRKADAYEKSLQAWKESQRIQSEFKPISIFRLRGKGSREISDSGRTKDTSD